MEKKGTTPVRSEKNELRYQSYHWRGHADYSRGLRRFTEEESRLEERSGRLGRCALLPDAEAQLAAFGRPGNVSGRSAICFDRRNARLEAAQRRWRAIEQVALSASNTSFWLRSISNLLRSCSMVPMGRLFDRAIAQAPSTGTMRSASGSFSDGRWSAWKCAGINTNRNFSAQRSSI